MSKDTNSPISDYLWSIQLIRLDNQSPIAVFQRNRSYKEYQLINDSRIGRIESIINKYSPIVTVYDNGMGVTVYL